MFDIIMLALCLTNTFPDGRKQELGCSIVWNEGEFTSAAQCRQKAQSLNSTADNKFPNGYNTFKCVSKTTGGWKLVEPETTTVPATPYTSAFCERAISQDRKGWTDDQYAAEANQRDLTFRDCDEMNLRAQSKP